MLKDQFDFSDSLSSSDLDEIQHEVDNMSSSRFIDTPGMYSLRVLSTELVKQKNPTPGWAFVKVQLEDVVDHKQIQHTIPVPLTTDVHWPTKSGKNQLWAIKKFQDFALALGIDARGKQMFNKIKEMFATDTALLGREGQFQIGYEHPTYAEPFEDGFLIMSNGKAIMKDGTDEVLKVPTRQDAQNYAETVLKRKYSRFMSLLVCVPKANNASDEDEDNNKVNMIGF